MIIKYAFVSLFSVPQITKPKLIFNLVVVIGKPQQIFTVGMYMFNMRINVPILWRFLVLDISTMK